ncbi:MAG: ATP-dependent helicase [Lachnospiraceae bacterium]|nr:ATP-dependent helicase [Lachnospiraceae bacterium]
MLLSKEQKQAVAHVNGPMLVLAGPGSGKTTVITMRVKNLVEKKHISPHNILVITYTRTAALEMRERFFEMCPKGASVTFATFHSFFFKLLRTYCPFETSDLITDSTHRELVKRAIEQSLPGFIPNQEILDFVLKDIALYKNMSIEEGSFKPLSCGIAEFNRIFGNYNRMLRENGNIDFDDILALTYGFLKKNPDIRKELSESFRYILIDEFQDINLLQYETVRLLENEEQNIFAVGDDDQAIYRFRGADPTLMKRFLEDHKESSLVTLPENHRCPKRIVEASSMLIRNNHNRLNKDLFSKVRDGDYVIKAFEKTSDEYSFVVDTCSRLIRSGCDPSSIAILFRNNYQPGALVSFFASRSIPFDGKLQRSDIYDSLPAHILLSYIAASRGDVPRDAALTIINVPERGIPRSIFTKKRTNLLEPEFKTASQKTKSALLDLSNDLKMMNGLDPFSCVKYIRKKIGLDRYIKAFSASNSGSGLDLIPILDLLEDDAREYATYADWCEHISIKRNTESNTDIEEKSGVRFLSFHSSKGLEFDTVFIIDTVEGVVPSGRAFLENNLEEERRMFYVALTRAKKNLYVLYAKEHRGKTAAPSRFIGEMNDP